MIILILPKFYDSQSENSTLIIHFSHFFKKPLLINHNNDEFQTNDELNKYL